ncbi:MAG: hypothetical protein NC350_06355 [Corallococcus sp.]|nr:hypothetical protein [Corallococcus sp.]
MNTLSIKINKSVFTTSEVTVDGQSVRFVKNKFGNYEHNLKTEKNAVEITLKTRNELNDRFWFLWSMLFFLISCFGIFDVRYNKNCLSYDCKFIISLTGSSVTVAPQNGNEQRVAVVGDCAVAELSNNVFKDERLKKRFKILRLTKLLTWIVIIAVATLVICVR